MLDLRWGNGRPPAKCGWRRLDGCCYVLKFWLDRIYSFGDSALFRFSRFGLKLPIPIHAHFYGVLRAYFPEMTSPIVLSPEGTSLHENAIKRENRSSGTTCAGDREKRAGQSKITNISPSWGEASTQPICIKVRVVVAVPDGITSGTEMLRDYDYTGGRIFGFPIAWALQQCSSALMRCLWSRMKAGGDLEFVLAVPGFTSVRTRTSHHKHRGCRR